MIVPTYRRSHLLHRLVDSLERQTLEAQRFEVVIVDNFSCDDTAAVLEERRSRSPLRMVVASTDSNSGPAAARNVGWRLAASPLLAFTDDDCVPDPAWLETGLAALERDPVIGVVQGRTRAAATGDEGRWVIRREISYESPWFEACNVFYRREAFEATGGFDETIRWFGEDTAAGWDVVAAGWERDFEPNAVVTHDLENRGMRWRLEHALLERTLVDLALQHPGLHRSAFWRPWAMTPRGPLALLAVLGLAASVRSRPAALAALPWLLARRHVVAQDPMLGLGVFAVDVAQAVGHLAGAVPHRRIIL